MKCPALAAAAATLLAAAPPLAAEFTVLTVDNRTVPATSFTRGAMDTLSFSRAPWMHANLPMEDIVEIALAGSPPRPAAPPLRVRLTNGDILSGSAGAADPDTVALASPSLGPLRIPLDQIDTILSPAQQKHLPHARPETAGADLLIRTGGDRISGLLKRLDGEQVDFDVEGKTVKVPARDLAGVYLTRVKEPSPPPATLFATVTVRDGSTFSGTLEEADAKGLRLRTAWPEPGQEAPRSIRVPLAELVFLYFRNGRCVYLSDLAPAKVEERALVEPAAATPGDPLAAFPFPWQRDRSVDPAQPRPLTLRGKVYRKGLGVHSYCALTYDLGGQYKRFFASAGLDDATAGRGPEGRGGSAVFEVWVDDRKVYNSGAVSVRDEPCEIDVPVEGAKSLKLVVDYGENYDLLDHADWAGARLIR